MNDLARLAAGNHGESSDLAAVLSILGASCRSYGNRAIALLGSMNNDADLTDLGPFVARRLLEATTTACLCRVDPVRLLYLGKCQAEESYELTTRHSASVQWTGDIIPDNRSKASANPWQTKSGTLELDRSLLSAHNAEIMWRPAFTELLNYIEDTEFSSWKENLQKITPDNFAPQLKGMLSQEFSALSKGTHQEFVIPTDRIYDAATVKSHIRTTFFYISTLALTSHFVSFSACRLPPAQACELFFSIGRQLEDLA